MSKKVKDQSDGGKVGINIWCEPALVERLDARLKELAESVGVPGVRVSRSAYVGSLLEKELSKG